jgi:alanine-synthesizing transaminase
MFSSRTNWNLAPNPLSEALARHRSSGRPLFDLTLSNPTDCGFEYNSAAMLESLANPASLEYTPDPQGLLSARSAVAGYYTARGDEAKPADIFITVSTSEAYSFAFRLLCDPGDELLVPAPSYPLLDFLADLHDVKLVRYPLLYDHGWQIDLHSLALAITPRTRAAVVIHPNNPTGHYCKPAEIARLNELCAPREIALIADEVFLDFPIAHTPTTHTQPCSFASNSAALTFTLSGLSKICGLPQIKAAWLVASGPAKLKQQAIARLEVIADSYLSPNSPVQLALPSLLARRGEFQAQVAARLRSNLGALDRMISTHKSVSRLALEGGWNAIVRVPAIRPDEALAVELLESKGVCVHPGHFYNFADDGYLVVSLLTPEPLFAEGIARLLSAF